MAFLGMQRPSAGAPRRRDGGNLPALASQAQWLAFMLFFGVLQASYFAAVRPSGSRQTQSMRWALTRRLSSLMAADWKAPNPTWTRRRCKECFRTPRLS